jgi:tRNA threonylcarbamoyladenosine biosynthesis protein TsaB
MASPPSKPPDNPATRHPGRVGILARLPPKYNLPRMTSPLLKPQVSLAIETSGHASSVALGIADSIVSVGEIAQRRHAVDLVPTIDRLFKDHALAPKDLSEIYISIGPGSFTGLRIGIAVAKLLARTTNAKIVAVPTIDSLAHGLAQVPHNTLPDLVAIMLNIKDDTGWANLYQKPSAPNQPWHPLLPSGLLPFSAITAKSAASPSPIGLIAEVLPESIESAPDPSAALAALNILPLPAELSISHAQSIWHIARAMSTQNLFTDPLLIAPIYARQPEAVTLWNKRHGEP